jgi:hypothetical protein
VALGFSLSLSKDRDRVLVGPGLAYDALGNDLLLSETVALAAPDPPAGSATLLAYDLALSRRAPAGILARRRQTEGCAEKVPAEGVEIRWVLAAELNSPDADRVAKDLHLGIEVPVGRFAFDPAVGAFSGPIAGFRANVRRLLRPHIATGTVDFEAIGLSPSVLDAVCTVLTKDAGFVSTPQYLVFLPENPPVTDAGAAGFVGPLLSVSHAEPGRFTLRATLAAPGGLYGEQGYGRMKALLAALSGKKVYWAGVEPVTGCQPVPDFSMVYSPMGGLISHIVDLGKQAVKPSGT